jgi:hypothetical protein
VGFADCGDLELRHVLAPAFTSLMEVVVGFLAPEARRIFHGRLTAPIQLFGLSGKVMNSFFVQRSPAKEGTSSLVLALAEDYRNEIADVYLFTF